MTSRLVVLTGYLLTGRTTVSKYLARLGFHYVCNEDVSRELFDRSYTELPNGQGFHGKVWEEVNRRKFTGLMKPQDTVVDSASPYNWQRVSLLDTSGLPLDMSVEKYLLFLRSTRETIARRFVDMRPDRSHEYIQQRIDQWESEIWEDIDENLKNQYTILSYENNTQEDLEAIKMDLRRRFERRDPLLVPP